MVSTTPVRSIVWKPPKAQESGCWGCSTGGTAIEHAAPSGSDAPGLVCEATTGGTCDYDCSFGYTRGADHVCGADGTFAGGSCDPMPCEATESAVIANSDRTAENPCTGVVGQPCDYHCSEGFARAGEHVCAVQEASGEQPAALVFGKHDRLRSFFGTAFSNTLAMCLQAAVAARS